MKMGNKHDTFNLEDTLINKPNFKNGDQVKVTIDDLVLEGKIVGKSIEHIIDMWIIQCDAVISKYYPFVCFTAPHTQIERID